MIFSSYANDLFVSGTLPELLYVTRQEFGKVKTDRPAHRHHSICEMLLVYQGSGYFCVEDKVFSIAAGDALLANAGMVHEVKSANDIEIGIYCLGITRLHLKNLGPNQFISQDETPVYTLSAAESPLFQQIRSLFDIVYSMPLYGRRWELAAHMLAATIVTLILHLPHDVGRATCGNALASKMASQIRRFIDLNYAGHVSLERISRELFISPFYASRVFKKAYGQTLMQYLIRRRIGEAQTLLISSDYSATQISTMVGYDNTNYFSSLFSRIVGTTPIQYRNRYLESMRGQRIQ